MPVPQFLAVCAAAFALAASAALAQDPGGPRAPGDPFAKSAPANDFKLPSAAQTQDGRFKGFDYDKASRYATKLDVMNKTRQADPAEKERAFGGAAEYSRELGARDAMERFKAVESEMLKQDDNIKK